MLGEEELLEHEPDPGRPQRGQLPVGHPGRVQAGDAHRPAVRNVQGAHQVQQPGLARPGRAGYRHQLPRRHRQARELPTPPAVMRATVDVVLGNPDSTPGDLRGMAADIRTAVDHAEHLIGALLILARNERGLTDREELDLATAAEDVLDTISRATGGRTARWSRPSYRATQCWPNASLRT